MKNFNNQMNDMFKKFNDVKTAQYIIYIFLFLGFALSLVFVFSNVIAYKDWIFVFVALGVSAIFLGLNAISRQIQLFEISKVLNNMLEDEIQNNIELEQVLENYKYDDNYRNKKNNSYYW